MTSMTMWSSEPFDARRNSSRCAWITLGSALPPPRPQSLPPSLPATPTSAKASRRITDISAGSTWPIIVPCALAPPPTVDGPNPPVPERRLSLRLSKPPARLLPLPSTPTGRPIVSCAVLLPPTVVRDSALRTDRPTGCTPAWRRSATISV